jgi:hypothetical protein
MRLLIILLFSTILFGCDRFDFSSNDFNLNDTFDLKAQTVAHNYDCKINIYLDSVLYDTRCPLGFLCVWEGNAKVRFKFISNHIANDVILNTYSQFKTDTIVDGYKISLTDLKPYPRSGVKTEQKEYIATMIIKK